MYIAVPQEESLMFFAPSNENVHFVSILLEISLYFLKKKRVNIFLRQAGGFSVKRRTTPDPAVPIKQLLNEQRDSSHPASPWNSLQFGPNPASHWKNPVVIFIIRGSDQPTKKTAGESTKLPTCNLIGVWGGVYARAVSAVVSGHRRKSKWRRCESFCWLTFSKGRGVSLPAGLWRSVGFFPFRCMSRLAWPFPTTASSSTSSAPNLFSSLL